MISLEKLSSIPSRWLVRRTRCRSVDCSSQTWLRALARRGDGIRIADKWYCSPDCFELATKHRIVELCKTPGRPAPGQKSRIPLGLLLHSRGVLTKDQLERALDWHRESGVSFGDAAQQLGFATPEQVTAAVASQWSCPVFPLGEQTLAVDVRIPRLLLELYRMLPVHLAEKGRKLLVGFVSSVQYQILYTIEHMTGYAAQPCFITAHEYEHRMRSSSSSLRDDDLLFEHIMDAAEIGRIVRNYAVQLGAAQARIGKCRNYVWTRIWGSKRETDLLFRVGND